jgi:hypothetical protein
MPSKPCSARLNCSRRKHYGADGRVSENELAAYKELAVSLKKLHPDFVPENLGSQWDDADNWLTKIASIEEGETRKAVYAISEIMTIVDGQVGRKEVKRLKQIAKLVGTQVEDCGFYHRCRVVAWCVCFLNFALVSSRAIPSEIANEAFTYKGQPNPAMQPTHPRFASHAADGER